LNSQKALEYLNGNASLPIGRKNFPDLLEKRQANAQFFKEDCAIPGKVERDKNSKRHALTI
jgi:hypothetical protein